MSDAVTLVGNSRPWGGQAPGSPGDAGPYTDGQWRAVWRTLFDGTGNRGPLLNWGSEFAVTQRGAGANMSVDVDDGAAIIDGLWAGSAATVNLTVTAADALQARYDLVMLHWTAAAQTTDVEIVDGVAGAGVPPNVATYQNSGVEWAVPLAVVEVGAAVVNIVNADITDDREFCRFRLEGNDIVDGVTLTTDANHLISIAADGVGVDEINAAIAGDGLVGGSGAALDVNPDGVTLEINADTVRIAAAAAGAGLTGGGGAALAVNPDGATIVLVGDTVAVGTIDNTHIANRTRVAFLGANQLHESAGDPPTWGAGAPVAAEGWVCATAADSFAIGHWQAPVGLVTGAVTVILVWSHEAAGNQVCRWRLDYVDEMGCGDDLTAGTTSIAQNADALLAAAWLRMCTTLATTITMAAGQYLDFFVGREGTHGDDTLANDARLLGVALSYTADM